jgi:hypothetical protein
MDHRFWDDVETYLGLPTHGPSPTSFSRQVLLSRSHCASATWSLETGDLARFSREFFELLDCPLEVLQSGFKMTDVPRTWAPSGSNLAVDRSRGRLSQLWMFYKSGRNGVFFEKITSQSADGTSVDAVCWSLTVSRKGISHVDFHLQSIHRDNLDCSPP